MNMTDAACSMLRVRALLSNRHIIFIKIIIISYTMLSLHFFSFRCCSCCGSSKSLTCILNLIRGMENIWAKNNARRQIHIAIVIIYYCYFHIYREIDKCMCSALVWMLDSLREEICMYVCILSYYYINSISVNIVSESACGSIFIFLRLEYTLHDEAWWWVMVTMTELRDKQEKWPMTMGQTRLYT